MKRKRPSAPTHKAIARAHMKLLVELGIVPRTAHTLCWACRHPSGDPDLEHHEQMPVRAHIRAHARGGSGRDPGNYVLLCEICHRDQPDGVSRGAQLEWLRHKEHWQARSQRLTAPVIASIKAFARSYAGTDWVVGQWPREEAKDAMSRAWDYAAANSSHLSFDTERSNAMQRFVEEFRLWLKRTLPPEKAAEMRGWMENH